MPGRPPSPEKQREVIGEITGLLEKDETVLFLDPVHQIHNNENDYEWQIKGKDQTRNVRANTGRRRINVIGGLNPVTRRPITLVTEANCDQETLMVFLDEIRKEYTDDEKAVHIFLDNARYNRAYRVQAKAEELNIKLHYLPPYSPNLNLIERLWKFFKKEVVKNKYYATFQEFHDAIVRFFHDIPIHDRELETLLSLKFEIILES